MSKKHLKIQGKFHFFEKTQRLSNTEKVWKRCEQLNLFPPPTYNDEQDFIYLKDAFYYFEHNYLSQAHKHEKFKII